MNAAEHLVGACAFLIERLGESAPGVRVLATSRHHAGQIMAARGHLEQARQLWTAGLGILSPGQTDPAHRAVRAMLLQALGRAEEARQLAAELSKLGYSEPNFTRLMFDPGRSTENSRVDGSMPSLAATANSTI